MVITRGYKTELSATKHQVASLERHVHAARYIYNWALATRQRAYQECDKNLNRFALNLLLTQLKQQPDHQWLYEVSNSALQGAIIHLQAAFENFFRRLKEGSSSPGYPKFHSRNRDRQSFSLYGPTIKVLDDRHVKLPTLGIVQTKERGYIPQGKRILAAHISRLAGRWYLSIQIEEEIPDPIPPTGEPIGLHMGIRRRATTSDGTVYAPARPLEASLSRLRHLQRERSRRQLDSKRGQKTAARIERLHARIALRREWQHHQASRALVTSGTAQITVESYGIRELMQEDSHRQARSLADTAMGELRRQVKYKAQWSGVRVVETPKVYPSMRRCSRCGAIKDHKVRTRRYRCDKCGAMMDAEVNAAENLRQYGGEPQEVSSTGKPSGR